MTFNSLEQLRQFMHDNIARECRDWFGLPSDGPWVARAVDNWFNDDRNYDRRWNCITLRRPDVGKILDMAAGCGTFMLHGLQRGFDVHGVEPEQWKRTYFANKIALSGFPPQYASRMIDSFGEKLPFADQSFDLVTTFQTLEHVSDVKQCINEMLRVLKPGGVLYLRAPDYRCFFEPHYRLPFLPRMNKALARKYVSLLGRPAAGLETLTWTTKPMILRYLNESGFSLDIQPNRNFFISRKEDEIKAELPAFFRHLKIPALLNNLYQFNRNLGNWMKIGRQERVIDLWITRREPANVVVKPNARQAA